MSGASISLRGIDFNKVVQNYENGYYTNITVNKTTIKGTSVQEIGEANGSSDIYVIKDRSNSAHIIHRIGNLSFNSEKPYNTGIKCFNCDRQSTMGIPISYQRVVENGKVKHIYDMVDYYCDEKCAFRGLKKGTEIAVQFRDWRLVQSEQLLRHLYNLKYPGKKLVAAPEASLLKSRGGSMNDDIFHKDNVSYYQIPNVEFRPTRTEYVARIT